MSEGMNRVMLLGNLGADPELRYTPSGQAVLHMRLATNESFLDRNKVSHDRTEWHNVVVWGPRGEALAKMLTKGACILVEGWLRTSSYEKEGVKRYRTDVVAREICFTGRRSASAAPAEDPYAPGDDTDPLGGTGHDRGPEANGDASAGQDPRPSLSRAASAIQAPRPAAKNGRSAPARAEMDSGSDELPF